MLCTQDCKPLLKFKSPSENYTGRYVLQCGSCWAFSTVGAIEGINQIVTDKLVSLSEQELVDCDTAMDHGCHGGLMDFAFEFVKKNGGLDTEKDYKYTAEEDKCNFAKEDRHVVSIDGYEDVPGNDESSLLKVGLTNKHRQKKDKEREQQKPAASVANDSPGPLL